jgi:ribonuclease HII
VATVDFENEVWQKTGTTAVAGLDEAGRGALAGPVVAGAVILPLQDAQRLRALIDVDDSKRLTPATRERLFDLITANVPAYGVGCVPASVIDQHGIIAATKQAMTEALNQLQTPAEHLLIDGRIRLARINLPQQSIIRGDSLSISIAAASILAKVTRDRLMIELDDLYPAYGFARHKGYGTAYHCQAISRHGPTPEHRLTFAPLRLTLV